MSKKSKGFFVKTTDKVHIDFKVACAKRGLKMTDVIEKFMIEYSKQ
jgi:hypothetical protein